MTNRAPVALKFVASGGDHPQPSRQRYRTEATAISAGRDLFTERPDVSVWIRDTDVEGSTWLRIFGPLACKRHPTAALDIEGACPECVPPAVAHVCPDDACAKGCAVVIDLLRDEDEVA